jgi:hypothetical protein
MIVFATALLISAAAAAPEPREICVHNQLTKRVSVTFFVPGEPVPKGGYPVKTVKAEKNGCIFIPKDTVTVLTKVTATETVSCSPVKAEGVTQFSLYSGPDGTVCLEPKFYAPAP